MKKFFIQISGSLLAGIIFILAVSSQCLGQTTAQLAITMSAPYLSPSVGYARIDLQVTAGTGYVTNNTEYNGANLNGSWEALNFRFTSTATPALVNTDFVVAASLAGISSGSVTNVSAGGCYASQPAFNISFIRASPAADAGSTALTIATIDYPLQKGAILVTGNLTVRPTTSAACAIRETFWSNTNAANTGFRLAGTGNSVVLGNYASLPVKLLSFAGKLTDKQSLLEWRSVKEENTSHFEIEYSADLSGFFKIGFVLASGNSNTIKAYQFIHANPIYGNNYYRLKMVDNDGHYSYSRIINLVASANQSELSLYPNPASGQVLVSHPSRADDAQLSVVDMTGKLIKWVTASRNTKETKINIRGFVPGLYRIVWSDGTNKKSESLVIQ
jgi:hypothetical protein